MQIYECVEKGMMGLETLLHQLASNQILSAIATNGVPLDVLMGALAVTLAAMRSLYVVRRH
jgi:hypothetical protein